jgi:hypothetical protein
MIGLAADKHAAIRIAGGGMLSLEGTSMLEWAGATSIENHCHRPQ